VRSDTRTPPRAEHAGGDRKRQAWPGRVLLAVILLMGGAGCQSADKASQVAPGEASPAATAGMATEPARTATSLSAASPGVEPSPLGDRRQQLLDEKRRLDGRLQTLGRELAPYDRDRLRARPPDAPPGRVRGGAHEPNIERRELQQRNLKYRQRQIENQLRRQP
jgi:hypothetical protein